MSSPSRTQRFNAAKLLQSDINAWMSCTYKRCENHQACLGGARGTCTRTDGWPACTKEGSERMKEARVRWKRSKTYDTETSLERALRRMENDFLKLKILMKSEET